jgi:ABC-type bacteriocin/lantibiotic exporter with double-glycine peptidase domain
MERIKQKEDDDCGVACIAMLIQRYAGCPASSSYDAARAILLGKREGDLLKTRDLKRALDAFGIKSGAKRRPFSPASNTNMALNFDAIVGTKPRKDKSWHWMVWDSKSQLLHDPQSIKPNRKKVSHFICVGNV